MMSASPKIFKIGYYKERIVIVERPNFGYFGGKPWHVTMILVTRQDYIIHCIISIIPNVSVPHYFIDNSNYENVKLDFNARYVE